MLRLTIVACVLGVALANRYCTAGDRARVKSSWNSLWNSPDASATKITFGKAVFADLFKDLPETVTLFDNVNVADQNSPEFAGHMTRVLGGLDLCINLLDDPDALHAELDHLNVQHLAREGLKHDYFPAMLKSLDHILPQVLNHYDAMSYGQCLKPIINAISSGLP